MSDFKIVPKLKFKGRWRSYQGQVLHELDFHLKDSKLNIVAAPGAGKTTLGIEVLLRLKQPTLILAPTITIKNQWKQRILENFLPEDFDENLISTDIAHISEITISTYQGLHSLYKSLDAREELIKELKNNGIKTLILDEAHHLRTEWWATLNHLCTALEGNDFKTVSLTGTPPYDVSPNEWKNYNDLCGPVDAEISIPELVKAGDLCPHQDLIWFSNLTEEERQVVFDFETNRDNFFRDINEHSDFLYAVESSPFINNLENNVDIMYKNTNFTVALISYLLLEDELSTKARILAEFLELNIKQIPKFSYSVAEDLFEGICGEFQEYFKNVPLIKKKLKEYGLISHKTVDFTGKINFKKLFARSQNKLGAIYEITNFEYKNLQNNLREVVLLDYIGKGDGAGVNILTVFEKLAEIKVNCAILTGTLVVIPKTAKDELYKILEKREIERTKVLTVDFRENYLRVETYGNVDIVSVITELFERGYVNVLIGTAALLGEGWDSPCVNTLVIASVVGSFMLSNQMRGRALRIDKTNKNKTSDIWHLVSLTDEGNSPDLAVAQKRFATFEGISYRENKIQNGIERLAINPSDINSLNCDKINKKMMSYASAREQLSKKWEQVFDKSCITEKNLAPKVYDVVQGGETMKTVVAGVIPKWCFGVENVIKKISLARKNSRLNFAEKLFLRACCHYGFIRKDYESIINKNILKYEHETALKKLATALLQTLCYISVIKTPILNIELIFNTEYNSEFYMTISGCTNYERNLFINAFSEMFEINDKNRYILKREDKYLAVPTCIAGKNKNVKKFADYLMQNFGYFDIIYTRNPNGYKELLKSKFNGLDVGYSRQSRVWI